MCAGHPRHDSEMFAQLSTRESANRISGHGHRFVRVALRSVLSAPKPSAAEPRARKGVCGKDAGPKPTGTSSRRPLRPEVGCPKGKRNQTAETMTNAEYRKNVPRSVGNGRRPQLSETSEKLDGHCRHPRRFCSQETKLKAAVFMSPYACSALPGRYPRREVLLCPPNSIAYGDPKKRRKLCYRLRRSLAI